LNHYSCFCQSIFRRWWRRQRGWW